MLEKTPARLEKVRKMYTHANGNLEALDRLWKRESDQAGALVEAYWELRDIGRRIQAASGRGEKRRNTDPVARGILQRVITGRTNSPR